MGSHVGLHGDSAGRGGQAIGRLTFSTGRSAPEANGNPRLEADLACRFSHGTRRNGRCTSSAGFLSADVTPVSPGSAARRPAARRPAEDAGGSDSRDGSPAKGGHQSSSTRISRPIGKMGPHLVLRQIAQAEPSQRGTQDQGDVVEDELPLDAHLQFAPVLLELPSVKAAIGRQPEVDAIVRPSDPAASRGCCRSRNRRAPRPRPCACPARCGRRSCPWPPVRRAARRRRSARRRCRSGRSRR